MNLEEKLRMAKRFNYDNIKVDVDRFETRLFNDLSKNKHITKGRFQMKWKVASIVAVVSLVTSGAVFASSILNVKDHTVSRLKTDVPTTSFITNDTNNQNIAKVYDLSQARAVAKFPIREPASISGWKHTESVGILWKRWTPGSTDSKTQGSRNTTVQTVPVPNTNASATNSLSPSGSSKATSVDAYYDVYTNNSGQQITVEQIGGLDMDTANNPDGSKIQFGADNYKADLYSSGGQKDLLIIKKESDNTITHIQVTGNVTDEDLKTIGDVYISASDSN